ncbi:MAG: serine hydrolase domain-containing protein [Gemmatimonadota bacterium]|nr:serine hydrolase domain-containing protein [Gemmatimonadota bacterium]
MAIAATGLVTACVAGPVDEHATIERLDGSRVTADSLSARIEWLADAADVHGLVVAVFNDAEAVYAEAFGFADAPSGRPLTLDTEMYGASLSKAVFGVLSMTLVDDGILDLDAPLVTLAGGDLARVHGPEWHEDFTSLAADPRLETVTARHALSHTTGLPNWRWIEDDQLPRFHFDPGARYAYSGEGMVLLQLAIRATTGQPLETLMRERVFEPYGMSLSSYRWQPHFESDYALGHRGDGSTYPKDKDNEPRAPSTLETTPREYIRFLEAVLRGEGLSAAARDEMFSPQIRIRGRTQFGPGATEETDANDDIELSYGLGWGLIRTPAGWGAFKEGHGDGFQHYSIIFPDTGLGVLLMSNSDNAESIWGYLLEATIANTHTPLDWQGWIPFDRRPETP